MKTLNSFLVGVFYLSTFFICPFITNASSLSELEIDISTDTISGLSYYYLEGPSPSSSFIITPNTPTENITVTPPSYFEISSDNNTFQNSPIIISNSTEITIYTRLKELQPINSYTGNIAITSTGTSTKNILLKGEVWIKNAWGFLENFNNAKLTSSYQTDSFIGNNNMVWHYENCRDERGSGTHFMKYTNGIKLKDASSKITSSNIPKGIKSFECKLLKGSASSTKIEVDLYMNDTIIATSTKFNDAEMHIFSVENMNAVDNTVLEIRNKKSVSVIIDDISWTNYNNHESRFIHTSHAIATHIIRSTDGSFYKDAAITIHAKNLISNLIITAPERFLISADNVTFHTSLTLQTDSGDIQNKNIYIQLNPIQSQRQYIGNLTFTSDSTKQITVKCIGATRPPTNTALMINEVDADTKDVTGASSTDEYDFIELYTGQPGIVDLSGYVLVLYNGSSLEVLKKYALTNYTSNQQGYFVMGDAAVKDAIENYNTTHSIPTIESSIVVKNNMIQKGPDAVALFYGVGGDFSAGDTLTTVNLADAMVYTFSDDKQDYPTGLMPLLNKDQPYVNENAYNGVLNGENYDKETNSMGRVTNGEGGLRNTLNYVPCIPTPGMANTALLHNGVLTQTPTENNDFTIYASPNTIHITGSQNGRIDIINMKGVVCKSILKSSNYTTTSIYAGIYIVSIHTQHTIQTHKVMVPHK